MNFTHDGISFEYSGGPGDGLPFVFQHDLGADLNEPLRLLDPPPGINLLAFDFRAHGETEPVGDPNKISVATFADDLGAFLDYLAIDVAIVGGISLGAAVALNFALRYPERVIGLILSRPVTLNHPIRDNDNLYRYIAVIIRKWGARQGLELFRQSDIYRFIRDRFPETAQSLEGQFASPRAEDAIVRLERIPDDFPCAELRELESIQVPTLILANRQDPIHPFEYGQVCAQRIAGSEFAELTSRSVSKERHVAETNSFIEDFLRRHFFKGQ